MAANSNLHKAKNVKNDEFYTQLTDVENELKHYTKHFRDKVVYCNCDDPTWSAFWKYFHLNFEHLGLKKLISTHYDRIEPTYKMEYEGGDDENIEAGVKTPLEGNGDFRNAECIELLKESDIVVTNPPFSLFREYVAQLMEYEKKFVIIGNKNAIAYKEVFPLLRDGKMFVGYNAGKGTMHFATELIDNKRIGAVTHSVPSYWYTNLDLDKSHEPLILTKNYTGNEDKYPNYYNYDAIDVGSVADIPKDYYGKMGVPITVLAQYCPEQFEIIGLGRDGMGIEVDRSIYDSIKAVNPNARPSHIGFYDKNGRPKEPYNRIIIQRKTITQED